jgi:hypothetical protein
MSTKRRLTLMPEILPTPQIASAGAGAGASSVRNRTLARLKILAALGAAGLAASCGRTLDDGGGTNGGGDGGLPDGPREAGEDAYGVVDPLPRPSCFQSALPTATGSYVNDAGDAGPEAGNGDELTIDVVLSFPQTGVAIGTVTPSHATFVSSTPVTGGVTLRFKVSSLETQAGANVQVSCSTGPSAIRLDFTLNATDVAVAVREAF